MNAGAIDGKVLITSPRLQPGVSNSESLHLKRASALTAIISTSIQYPQPFKGLQPLEGASACRLSRPRRPRGL